ADRAPRFRHRRAGARPDRGAARRVPLRACPGNARCQGCSTTRPPSRARGRPHRWRGLSLTTVAPLAFSELLRAPGRTIVRVLTLAAAVGLLGAMLLFVGHSLGTMTGGAVRSVPLDWQGPVGSYRAATSVAAGVARQPGVAEAVPTATAPFAGLEHTSPTVGTIRSGPGPIL